MESIFRVQYIDYTIENENNTLKTLRNNYFNIKKQAEEHILKYIAASTAKQRGEYLVEKYNIFGDPSQYIFGTPSRYVLMSPENKENLSLEYVDNQIIFWT